MSYSAKEIIMTICRLLYAFSMFSCFLVILMPVRILLMEYMKIDMNTKKGGVVFKLIGLVVAIITVCLSIAVPSIVTVLNFISTIFGTGIYWLLPLCFIYISPKIKVLLDTRPTNFFEK